MKRLLLIRHAKAEKDTAGKDIDRPLKYTGIQDAAFMAERVKEKAIVPQVIFTSPALRTKTTAEIFTDHLRLATPAVIKSIYEASQQSWLKAINKLSNDYDFIGIVGHNPGIAQILYFLTGEVKEVHTSTIALIDFETDDWATISGDTGKLVYYGSPNE
jgi:phosphohistidine phosphatase|eukprot:gene8368-8455_t